MIRNAGGFNRRFEATERNVRLSGMSNACSIGFKIWSQFHISILIVFVKNVHARPDRIL